MGDQGGDRCVIGVEQAFPIVGPGTHHWNVLNPNTHVLNRSCGERGGLSARKNNVKLHDESNLILVDKHDVFRNAH